MKFLILLFPILAFAQNIPSDQVKIGRPQTAADKELIFDTNDGVSNKKLSIEKTSKLLKFDGNSFQLGDGAATDKSLIINGTSGKALKYDSASSQFEFNDDLGINGFGLKTNSINSFSGTETAIEQNARVKGKLNLGVGTNEIRVESGNLEFSNDGLVYKKIGSGSGGGDGGVNLALNPSFEDGAGNWTATGGTYSVQPYANPSEGDLNYARYISSGASQTLCSDAIVVPDFLNGGCVAYSQYKTTDNNAFELQVLSESLLINKQVLPTTNGLWLQTPPVALLCPAVGDNIQVCYESLSAATIEVDKVYKGSENRTVQTSDAGLVGGIVISGCSFSSTSTSFADLSTVNGTCIYTPFGKALAPTSDLPAIRFPRLNSGEYRIEYTGAVSSGRTGGVSAAVEFRAFDGADASRDIGSVAATTQADNSWSTSPSISFSMAMLTDRDNVSISIQGRTTNASFTTPRINQNQNTNVQGVIRVYYVPSATQTAVTNSQSAWFIDANIGGNNISTTASSSYLPFTDTTLDMVINAGSAPATIPCSATNPSTGLTCSAGSEQVGVVFTPPYTGFFDVCVYAGGVASTGQVSTTQLVETENNSQTIIQEGKSRIAATSNGVAGTVHANFNNCGTFLFSSTGLKTIRYSYEADGSGTTIYADRSSTYGQRDIRVTVRPSTQNIARPVLTGDTVTSPDAVKPALCSAKISATGVISDQIGGCFASCTNATTPVCTFTASYWVSGSIPNCWHSIDTGLSTSPSGKTTTATTFSGEIRNSAFTIASGSREYFCTGLRP